MKPYIESDHLVEDHGRAFSEVEHKILVIVRRVGRTLDAGVPVIGADLDLEHGIYIQTCQLLGLQDPDAHLKL